LKAELAAAQEKLTLYENAYNSALQILQDDIAKQKAIQESDPGYRTNPQWIALQAKIQADGTAVAGANEQRNTWKAKVDSLQSQLTSNEQALQEAGVALKNQQDTGNDRKARNSGYTDNTGDFIAADQAYSTATGPSAFVQSGRVAQQEQLVAFSTGANDWRFRISLAPDSTYLYNAEAEDGTSAAGILAPLAVTDGVIFPYSPMIQMSYTASYPSTELTHTNYKIYNYKGSAVEQISITGDFTAQDTTEANYMLAVIHFFKSVTKMFYGQDQNPQRGLPPPLVYLTGFGQYQFDQHPAVISSFSYNFPQDVDYVNAYPTNSTSAAGGQNQDVYEPKATRAKRKASRLTGIAPGGNPPPPTFAQVARNINEITRVPSKLQINITCLPVVTRNSISNHFSLAAYARGDLMKGSSNPQSFGGGIW
jgi:hypothetical protein